MSTQYPLKLHKFTAATPYGLRSYSAGKPQAAALDESGAVIAIACDDGYGYLISGPRGDRDGMRMIEDLEGERAYSGCRIIRGKTNEAGHCFVEG